MTAVAIREANLPWTAFRSAGCDRWIAECRPLGLSMEGDTLDEVRGLIGETMHALFLDLIEDGDLEAFLLEKGWTKAGP